VVNTVGNYLYVANSDSVSGFSINPATGVLTPVPGSPFPAGPVSINGISLAVTPDGQYLIAANPESNNATVYSITFHGTLTPIPGSPPGSPFLFPVGVNSNVPLDGQGLQAIGSRSRMGDTDSSKDERNCSIPPQDEVTDSSDLSIRTSFAPRSWVAIIVLGES